MSKLKEVCVWVPVFARLMEDGRVGSVSSPDFERVQAAIDKGLVVFETKGFGISDDDCDRADAAITDLMIAEIQR